MQIARILRALNNKKINVIWNDKFPDPDNPSQMRQVDISIRDGERLTLVECRLHQRKQDVKWVEELYGRRVSLNAESIIGVSSSGFTSGAIEKARRLGVFLRTLSELTDDEVAAWGGRTKTFISYIKFSKIHLCIVTNEMARIPRFCSIGMLRSENYEIHPIQHALNSCINHLCDLGAPEGPFSMQIFFEKTFLGTLPVVEAILQTSWQWIRCEVSLPTVLVYEDIVKIDDPVIFVEKSLQSKTEIHHRPNGSFAIIDVSTASPASCCFLREVKIQPGQGIGITDLALLGIDQSKPGFCKVDLAFTSPVSPDYLEFIGRKSFSGNVAKK